MILGLLTVVLLIGSAIFGAFNIARPLRALVVPLQRMAKGEAVELPGTERQDEIGETACAVNDIKVMLAEKARREAEAKIEQDKRAEAERQAAMQKMADEFEAAVGGIVQAAVAGDFSQRVDVSGKTGLVLNVGTAINSMCDNVGKALTDFDRMLDALAGGSLMQRISASYQGNFAQLKENANKTADRIGATIAEIKASAREVTNASAEIATSTDRPVAAHGGAGGQPGRDLGLDGRDLGDCKEERRERPGRQPVSRRYPRRRGTRWPGGRAGGRCHGQD